MSDFTRQQAQEIRKLLSRPPHRNVRYKPESFLLSFVHVEALLRLIGRYYRERSTQKNKNIEKHEPLRIDVVSHALAYFRVRVSAMRLRTLLDSKLSIRGKKSARNLRNGLGHTWDANDAGEVVARYAMFEKLFGFVIAAIRARVAEVSQ